MTTSLLWPGYYDVVILPPPAVRDRAIELSRRLFRSGGQWRLGKRNFIPHISLYHIPVRDENRDAFLDDLQRMVDSTTFGFLDTAEFDMPVMTLSKPEWLRNLQRRVMRRTVRYFNWDFGVQKTWSLHRFQGQRLAFAKQYLREYGTPMAGMNFLPHITLSSFKGTEPADVRIQIEPMRFRVSRLHVCQLGISHTCHRIVRELVPRSV